MRLAAFAIGQIVRHSLFDFRAVIFDVDPVFINTEEWWLAIPAALRPDKDQPFYHLLAETGEECYVAYACEAHLHPDTTGEPLRHPQTGLIFERFENGRYWLKGRQAN